MNASRLRAVHAVVALAIASLPMSLVAQSDAPSGGAWLDASPVAAWNQQGAAIPTPPSIAGEPLATGRCAGQVRPPEGPADAAVAKAGWTLVGPLQVFADTSIVFAAVAADGMCRPLGYQGFVFVRGRLAGTLSPHPMQSRTDGMIDAARLVSRDRVIASYLRYSKDDALCCPSRTSTVTFGIKRGTGGSLLTVENATTGDNPKP
jgi:hypothetical protein